jgi:hypothetical protein
MSDQLTPPESTESSAAQNVSGGVTVQPGGDASVGGDVVGRDKVTQTTTTVTNVGMSPEAVRRLVITVGAMVFITALCFFSGGLAVGAVALQALGRPVDSSLENAARFQAKLDQVNAAEPGQLVVWGFTESELSAYFRHDLGPRIGIAPATGRARFLPDGQVEFYGRWSGFLNLPVLAVTNIKQDSAVLYHTQSAAVRLFGSEDSAFGLIAVPDFVVQPLIDAINADIGHQLVAKQVQYPDFRSTVTGDSVPERDSELLLGGVAQ